MISVQEAKARLLAACPQAQTHACALDEAVGHWLAQDIVATQDRPALDRAAMDGFALRAQDLAQGRTRFALTPAHLASNQLAPALAPGHAMPVTTGASLPTGADTVLRLERAQREGDQIHLKSTPEPGQDLRRRGEEWQRGDLLLRQGGVITPEVVALCAANGIARVTVAKAPRVCVGSSGDEIVPGSPASVPDSNGPYLRAFCRTRGVLAQAMPPLLDELEALTEALRQALSVADLVITSGGMSVGERDLMTQCAKALGAQMLFHQVAVRPGKPVGAAKYGTSLWLMLPGSPGAVAATAQLFLDDILSAMGAPTALSRSTLEAVMPQGLPSGPAPRHRVLAAYATQGPRGLSVQAAKRPQPHRLLPMARASGYAVIGPWEPGQTPPMVHYKGQMPTQRSWPRCVAITGPSGSGKTTLITRLLDVLSRRAKVVVIKHSHHSVPPEAPHKDTAKFLRAGARDVLFVSGNDFVLRSQGPAWQRHRLEQWVSQLEPAPDLVLVEGFSALSGTRVEVVGPDDPRDEATLRKQAQEKGFLACVARQRAAPQIGLPVFDSEAIDDLAHWLLPHPEPDDAALDPSC